MPHPFQNLFKTIFGGKADNNTLSVPELPRPRETATNYAALISRVLSYFGRLNEANKQRFLKTVYNFRKAKSFHFHRWEPTEEIAILVSAAAVQVSFGLKSYHLSFFTSIYILSDAIRL
jgi:hypothetical protein